MDIEYFKLEIRSLFYNNSKLSSFSWEQYTSVENGFPFLIENVKVVNDDDKTNFIYRKIVKMLNKYDGDFFYNNFGDYTRVCFHSDGLISLEDITIKK